MSDFPPIIFHSKLLDDEVVVIFRKEDYHKARFCYPEHAIYTPRECLVMKKVKALKSGGNDAVRRLHEIKKKFGGWITEK